MFLALALAGTIAAVSADTLPAPSAADTVTAAGAAAGTAAANAMPATGPVEPAPAGVRAPAVDIAPDDTIHPRRRKAFEISDAYATRLKIHYIASYATLPIFAAQAIVGEQLFHNEQNGFAPSQSLRTTHDAIAITLGALFVTNTVTGSMNWWETRHEPAGRTWRTIHAALMLLSDAGFAYTASLGERGAFLKGGGNPARDLHRNWAEISVGTALVGYVMMWKPIRGSH
ncbi:MAG TPA: hypothetical protein VN613_00240 [Gemmatimonadaceae bacterium]|nr:hypothetical protein [Gemmatimonadaceae bacterium]